MSASAPLVLEESSTPEHHIVAQGSSDGHHAYTLKHGDTFLVFDRRGDLGLEPGSAEGLYHRDTRILSRFELLLQDARPLLLSSTNRDDNATFAAGLSNPDFLVDGQIVLRREQLQLQRLRFVWKGALHERLLLRNYSESTLRLRLSLRFAADFADLFEVRGERRQRRGRTTERREGAAAVSFSYRGLDEQERVTRLDFDPPPTRLDTATAVYELELKPHQSCRMFCRVGVPGPAAHQWDGRSYYREMRAAHSALRRSARGGARIDSSNELFNASMRRALSDLQMLVTDTPCGPYPYAGTPWFSTPFGRDGIITALLLLWLDPGLARGVLRFLAATQATAVEPERDAEPGKILHEMRHGEMARLKEVPFERYYGSVDATPLFVLLLGAYFERSGDLDTVRELWPKAEAALAWIDRYGDRDGDGFVEYYRMTGSGLANQGWKDSQDSVFHADGRMASGPIALCEVQAYVYGAKQAAAAMARALGQAPRAAELERQAESLRQRFEETYWCEELGVYALALDGDKRPCRVVTSNAGQVLLTGIASPERARRVAQVLGGPDCSSGWGIRTVARSAARYNPMSYHNGSVWPHDNALIALGLSRYGLQEAVLPVFNGLFEATNYMELRRLPELFCGFPRRRRSAPTQYPVACTPQAWASATLPALLQACIGLELHRPSNEIRFRRPQLPEFLDELVLHGLSLGEGSADVRLHRHGEEVSVTVLERRGAVEVVVRH